VQSSCTVVLATVHVLVTQHYKQGKDLHVSNPLLLKVHLFEEKKGTSTYMYDQSSDDSLTIAFCFTVYWLM